MTTQPSNLHQILTKMRYDLTSLQGKLTDALNMLNDPKMPTPAKIKCPECGLPCKGPNTLAEHRYTSHGGPLPPVWATADHLALEREDDTDLVRLENEEA